MFLEEPLFRRTAESLVSACHSLTSTYLTCVGTLKNATGCFPHTWHCFPLPATSGGWTCVNAQNSKMTYFEKCDSQCSVTIPRWTNSVSNHLFECFLTVHIINQTDIYHANSKTKGQDIFYYINTCSVVRRLGKRIILFAFRDSCTCHLMHF